MTRAILILTLTIVGVPAVLYAFWMVHRLMDGLCLRHARKFCQRGGLEIHRLRSRPEFEPSGVKTEFTLVQLDCHDAQRRRRLVLLSVWPLGVRRTVSDESYPETHDREWPQTDA